MLPFSHMLLDWRGPGLHALSFWLQAPPPSAPLSYTLTYTQNIISVWLGQSLFPLTAVISVCWQRLQKKLDKEASYPMTALFLLLSSSILHTCTAKTHTQHTKTWPWAPTLAHAYTLLYSHTVGVHSYRLKCDAGFLRLMTMWIFEINTNLIMVISTYVYHITLYWPKRQ